MAQTREQQALQLIEDMWIDGCIASHINPDGSDYHCRYCDSPTKSHRDFTIQHDRDCTWLKIEQLQKQ